MSNDAAIVQLKARERAIEGAKNYTKMDRSDPFTLARCLTHVNMGICRSRPDGDKLDCCYAAEEYQEERSFVVDGRTVSFTVPAYKNLVRP